MFGAPSQSIVSVAGDGSFPLAIPSLLDLVLPLRLMVLTGSGDLVHTLELGMRELEAAEAVGYVALDIPLPVPHLLQHGERTTFRQASTLV